MSKSERVYSSLIIAVVVALEWLGENSLLSHNVVDHYATFKKTADIKEDEEEKKCDKRKEWNWSWHWRRAALRIGKSQFYQLGSDWFLVRKWGNDGIDPLQKWIRNSSRQVIWYIFLNIWCLRQSTRQRCKIGIKCDFIIFLKETTFLDRDGILEH